MTLTELINYLESRINQIKYGNDKMRLDDLEVVQLELKRIRGEDVSDRNKNQLALAL